MGTFYGSIHVRTGDVNAVQKSLDRVAKETNCKLLLGPPLNGWTTVFPDHSGQNEQISAHISRLVPLDIFHLIVHDDDLFLYYFYSAGRLVDQYNCCPDYFGEISGEKKQQCQGHPELFQHLLREPTSLGRLKTLLAAGREEFVFESERMTQFVGLLGLSNALSSYEHLQAGNRDGIVGWESFIHIQRQPDPAEDCGKKAKAKREEGELDGALADYNKAIELNPGFAAAYNNRGRAKKAKGDLDGALADYNRAIELNPHLAAAFSNRGLIKKTKGDLDGALADYDKAIELKPDMATAYNNRAGLKRARGDWDGAMADYTKAIELKPDLAEAYGNRGVARKAKGDLDNALADYNKAIELKPDEGAVYSNRGELKKIKGDLDGALSDFNRAIELKPDAAAIYSNRGELKKTKGDLDGALADCNRAIALKPDLAAAYNNRGMIKKAKKDLDGAVADFNRAIELKPDIAAAYNNRGLVKTLTADLDGALADYNRAIEIKPDLAEAYHNRGGLKKARGDLDGALADYNKAIELKPNAARTYNNRGLVKRAKGDLNGALADYDKAIELKPDLAEAYNNRGEARRTKGGPTAASLSIAGEGTDKIPTTENALVLRTDYSDEPAWKALCAAVQDPHIEFPANVDFVSHPKYDGLSAEELSSVVSGDSPFSFAFIIDRIALSHPEHPILVVGLRGNSGRTFRVIPSAIGLVENNLSIGNMDFADFANAADPDGIFRGL